MSYGIFTPRAMDISLDHPCVVSIRIDRLGRMAALEGSLITKCDEVR